MLYTSKTSYRSRRISLGNFWSVDVKKVQIRLYWSHVESGGDQKRISWEDLSESLGDVFYERDVISLGKQLCE